MKLRASAQRYADPLLAGVLAMAWVAEIAFTDEVPAHRATAAAVAVLMEAALAVRRSLPVLPMLAVLVVVQLNHTVLVGLAEGGAFMVTFLVADYSAGRHGSLTSRIAGGVLVLVFVPLAALDPRQPPATGDWIFFVVFAAAPLIAGTLFRHRHGRDVEVAERSRRIEEESRVRAVEAVAAERARIARELHDVVAHAISVIVVQARGGRRQLESAPASAQGAFDAIEQSGEQALAEMRRLLDVLRRTDDAEATLAPQPGLGSLPALVAELAAAGLEVEVVRDGTPTALPAGLDLSAYRIVQEALTNVVKHAGPTRACVLLHYAPDNLEIEVRDDGDGTGPGGGSGYGLTGIRERVALYGGRLTAGARSEGGFAVRATLPLQAAP